MLFRFLSCATHLVSAIVLMVVFTHPLCAEPPNLWNYKGSVVELSHTDSGIVIVFKTPSELLRQSGAMPGDLLFRGERVRDALSGTFYKFYGRKCGSRSVRVSGTITDRRIEVNGQAPALGANCETAGVAANFLSLSAIANAETDRAEVAANDMTTTNMNAGLCKNAHDSAACDAALPLALYPTMSVRNCWQPALSQRAEQRPSF